MTSYTTNLRLPIPDFLTEPWEEEFAASMRAIDTAIANALLAINVSVWANSTAYTIGHIVTSPEDPYEGPLWICAVAHTSSASPTTFAEHRTSNPTHWIASATIPQQRGTWTTATAYIVGDFVLDTGRYAVCLIAHTSGTFNTDLAAGKWSILIDTTTIRRKYASVRASAIFNNVVIASGLESGGIFGSITLATGDRIALFAQTAPAENGVYVVQASGAAVRADDFSTYDDHVGALIYAEEGTNAETIYKGTSNAGGILGTTAITFAHLRDDNVRYDAVTTLTDAQEAQARANIYAAPFDALAFNGMQVNGSCIVSQERGIVGTSTSGAYPVDNWALVCGGAAVVTAVQGLAGPPGIPSHIAITVGTADASIIATDFVGLLTIVEGYRFARMGWGASTAQPITIGFWTAHHRTGVYGGSFRNSATDRSYTFEYTQSVADAWQFNTVTVVGDQSGTWLTTTGVGLYVTFTMMAGSNTTGATGAWTANNDYTGLNQINGVEATSDVFRITGLMVLPGIELPSSDRAPFLMRPFGTELDLCRRYWEKSYNYEIAPGTASNYGGATGMCITGGGIGAGLILGNHVQFKTSKRATPTVTFYNPETGTTSSGRNLSSSTNFTPINQAALGHNGCQWYDGSGGSTGGVYCVQWVANARL